MRLCVNRHRLGDGHTRLWRRRVRARPCGWSVPGAAARALGVGRREENGTLHACLPLFFTLRSWTVLLRATAAAVVCSPVPTIVLGGMDSQNAPSPPVRRFPATSSVESCSLTSQPCRLTPTARRYMSRHQDLVDKGVWDNLRETNDDGEPSFAAPFRIVRSAGPQKILHFASARLQMTGSARCSGRRGHLRMWCLPLPLQC